MLSNNLDDYNFHLPAELIASVALDDRSACRLLYLGGDAPRAVHDRFINIGNYLRDDDVLVVNNTKVMKARIFGFVDDQSVELLLARRNDGFWTALVYSKARLTPGAKITITTGEHSFIDVFIHSRQDDGLYRLQCDADLGSIAEEHGEMPIPPYFKRKATASDEINYQTVYAKHLGAVAAPTAGLHFTDEMLNTLKARGISVVETTLHVGPGTFLPIRTKVLDDHRMHGEHFILDEESAVRLNDARRKNRRIIPVGSTAMRVLEHVMQCAREAHRDEFFSCAGETSIFIRPGYKFLACDGIITNFHIPRSTLILLVAAVAGRERILRAYHEAIEKSYRFYSYGDATFLEVCSEYAATRK